MNALPVVFKRADILFSHFLFRNPFGFCLLNDLIVDVGEIGNKGHLIAEMNEKPPQNIERHDRTHISDMDVRVNRRTAYITGHFVLPNRLKHFFPIRQTIVNLHFHIRFLPVIL